MNELTKPSEVRRILEAENFRFTKSLGQNFLINPAVCPAMAAESERLAGRQKFTQFAAVEIGAGVGVLTRELSRVAERVTVIEKDSSLLPVLEKTLAGCENVTVLSGDALKLLDEVIDVNRGMPVVVCANLPYYITTPVITRLLPRADVCGIVVMVQREAAQRLSAKPGTRECGSVSVMADFYADVRTVMQVGRGSFMPPPSVDSTVLSFEKHTPPLSGEAETLFFKITRAAFGKRRKQLAAPVSEALGVSRECIRDALTAAGINTAARAEELTTDDFVRLTKELNKR